MTRLLILFFCLMPTLSAGDPWLDQPELAIDKANRLKQPLLVYFTASWCGPCQRMKVTTLADAAVNEAMKPYVALKVDIDQRPDVAAEFSVSGVPSFVVVTPGGKISSRVMGFQEASGFVLWLKQGHEQAEAAWEQARNVERLLAKVPQALKSGDSDEQKRAVNQLFTLIGSREPKLVEAAHDLLTLFASEHPQLFLVAAKHPDLLVRVAVAQALGDAEESFDPWLPPQKPAQSTNP